MAHNWRRNTIVIVVFAVGALASNALAVEIGWFPGLKKLIDQSDAIVILRVDHDVDTGNLDSSLTGYTTHDCYIYQSLKGVLPAGESVRLRLMNTGPGRGPFGRSYMRFSAHLVFLTKRRREARMSRLNIAPSKLRARTSRFLQKAMKDFPRGKRLSTKSAS